MSCFIFSRWIEPHEIRTEFSNVEIKSNTELASYKRRHLCYCSLGMANCIGTKDAGCEADMLRPGRAKLENEDKALNKRGYPIDFGCNNTLKVFLIYSLFFFAGDGSE